MRAVYHACMDLTSVTPGVQQLKALSHPVRVRMLGLLRVDGPATATMLATRLGLNSGATSYHLRQLAQHGFVVDDEARGNGRERWWQAAHSATTTRDGADKGAEGEEALDAYLQSVAVVMTELLQRAVEERPLLSKPWRDASQIGDWVIELTPRRARAVVDALITEIQAVEEDEDDEAEAFVIQLHAFPLPGRIGGGS